MRYNYKCKKCGKIETIECSREELKNQHPICCGDNMIRDFSGLRIDNQFLDDATFNMSKKLQHSNVINRKVLF